MTSETITYQELAKRLDSVFLFNKAPELDPELYYEGLVNGSLWESDDETDENVKDIFQWYLISANDADYLKRHTDELIFYSNVLDEYLWGITHFGTSWEGVYLEFKD